VFATEIMASPRIETRWTPMSSFESLGAESCDGVFVHAARNFDGLAAHFAVFHVGLTADGKVHDHRNLFAAIWANEKMFH